MAHMSRRRKLNPTLVSMLVERWRPETYKFHLPYGKCIIRLEDVQLQLGLSVGRPVVTRLVVTTDWKDVCEQLLGRVLDTIFRGRIDMNWLKRNFVGFNAKSSEVEREQHTRAYILRITRGLLMPDKSWNHRPSYVGQPEKLKDIQLLLDQQSEADMPYSDSRTQAYILSEFLVNPNIWHVNVPLAMPWFRHHSKPYLLSKVAKGRQRHMRRPQRAPRKARFGAVAEAGPLSTPTQEEASMAAPPPGQYGSTYFGAFTNPILFTQAPQLAPHLYVSTPSLGFFCTTTFVPTILPTDAIDNSYSNYVYSTDEKMKETQWQLSSTPQSTIDEGEKDGISEPENVPEGGGDDEYKEEE
ncbi:hypothetical protein Golob_017981 [Gossypium lobatum]|uniref:Aminotransferase-like plant mobile domain-containing protein n=1 Tax=Gossypium lobatum TaxID=34289 RepID=A0A7J8M980_9ROSI|nr:hypothetical protein [Gossypium lobatum]